MTTFNARVQFHNCKHTIHEGTHTCQFNRAKRTFIRIHNHANAFVEVRMVAIKYWFAQVSFELYFCNVLLPCCLLKDHDALNTVFNQHIAADCVRETLILSCISDFTSGIAKRLPNIEAYIWAVIVDMCSCTVCRLASCLGQPFMIMFLQSWFSQDA